MGYVEAAGEYRLPTSKSVEVVGARGTRVTVLLVDFERGRQGLWSGGNPVATGELLKLYSLYSIIQTYKNLDQISVILFPNLEIVGHVTYTEAGCQYPWEV